MSKPKAALQTEREPEQVTPKDSQLFAINLLSGNQQAKLQQLAALQNEIAQIGANLNKVLTEIESEQHLKSSILATGYQWNGSLFVKSTKPSESKE